MLKTAVLRREQVIINRCGQQMLVVGATDLPSAGAVRSIELYCQKHDLDKWTKKDDRMSTRVFIIARPCSAMTPSSQWNTGSSISIGCLFMRSSFPHALTACAACCSELTEAFWGVLNRTTFFPYPSSGGNVTCAFLA